ncbi:hypothetical protein AO718_20120 [Aeromonas veronii]|nr:hypothetical protein AO718_20120 [Aeromonas veronii]KRV97246.1 hypothetical protein AO725_04880 [Aeromonas veronii]KRW07186.1 hypothetical protein AO732_12025 [Aeromonas veronii]KRW09701.1 hypothetical protein AO745_18525 [Aeromonas veronii]KRW19332.1 hypothetical protein AO722_18200 [Aeromonas veronii]
MLMMFILRRGRLLYHIFMMSRVSLTSRLKKLPSRSHFDDYREDKQHSEKLLQEGHRYNSTTR